jgi:hypothetical protein
MRPLEQSSRSGKPLEPDKPVTVTYLFEDGERREVTVTAAEADDMLQQGEPRTSSWGRTGRAVWRLAKPAGKWLAVALVGGVLGAEISDRYADRQRELELEASLITHVSEASVKLFQDAQEASRASDNPRQQEQRDRAADEWVLRSGSITPVFRAYFAGGIASHWDEYQQAMYDWAVLGCCTTADGRPKILARIRTYIEDHVEGPAPPFPVRDPWAALETATPPAAAYQWLGRYLLRGRGEILNDLKEGAPDLD